MARFAPNFHHQFLELPVRERFPAAAKLGFDAVEWHFPYELSKSELKSLLDDNGLKFTYGVVPANWSKKEFGIGGLPGREDEFRRAADIALDYALHVPFGALNVGHGQIPVGVERQRCVETYVRNLQYVCDQAKGSGLIVAVEPVTTGSHGASNVRVLRTMEQAEEVVRLVNRESVKLVYDTYHLRMEESGTLSGILEKYWPLIGHVQFGNAPTRNEPGIGEIDFDWIVQLVDKKGYKGWIGLEYNPSKDTWSSLSWVNRYGYHIDPRQRSVNAG
jgi:hydroxypyruvate isomerase